MDKRIQIDKVIHYDFLHLAPVYIRSELIQLYHVLHQQQCIDFQLCLVSNERIFHYYQSFLGFITYHLVFFLFSNVTYGRLR